MLAKYLGAIRMPLSGRIARQIIIHLYYATLCSWLRIPSQLCFCWSGRMFMIFCEESHSPEELGLIFCENKNNTISLFIPFVCFLWTGGKLGRTHASNLVLILCVSWRGLGRRAREMITFFLVHLNFLRLVPSSSITFAKKKKKKSPIKLKK